MEASKHESRPKPSYLLQFPCLPQNPLTTDVFNVEHRVILSAIVVNGNTVTAVNLLLHFYINLMLYTDKCYGTKMMYFPVCPACINP